MLDIKCKSKHDWDFMINVITGYASLRKPTTSTMCQLYISVTWYVLGWSKCSFRFFHSSSWKKIQTKEWTFWPTQYLLYLYVSQEEQRHSNRMLLMMWTRLKQTKTTFYHSKFRNCKTVTRDFPDGSKVRNPLANAGDLGLIPGSGRSPGGGNGNPLQHSCLKNTLEEPGEPQQTVRLQE